MTYELPNSPMKLHTIPITWAEAKAFNERYHRHLKNAPLNRVFHVAAGTDHVCGVSIVERLKARGNSADPWAVEITRQPVRGCCKNVPSFLYGAAWRIALGFGFLRLITYTRTDEPGISLRAAGFRMVAEVKGRSWDCPSRPRVEVHPLQDKLRWEKSA